ncbi:unnamed protein product [Amoebophrya sp. A25]|nr:unnamed protein product [Amoebophrya sp. A25]|eukprot:GSA25T00013395001.1
MTSGDQHSGEGTNCRTIGWRRATTELMEGRSIGYPTDTVWGIGCLADEEAFVRKCLEHKGGGRSPICSVLLCDLGQIETYTLWSSLPTKVHDAVISALPGRYTFVLPVAEGSGLKHVCGPGPSLGVRVIDAPEMQETLGFMRRPLLTTSLNLTKEPAATTLEEAQRVCAKMGIPCVDPDLVEDSTELLLTTTERAQLAALQKYIAQEENKDPLDFPVKDCFAAAGGAFSLETLLKTIAAVLRYDKLVSGPCGDEGPTITAASEHLSACAAGTASDSTTEAAQHRRDIRCLLEPLLAALERAGSPDCSSDAEQDEEDDGADNHVANGVEHASKRLKTEDHTSTEPHQQEDQDQTQKETKLTTVGQSSTTLKWDVEKDKFVILRMGSGALTKEILAAGVEGHEAAHGGA